MLHTLILTGAKYTLLAITTTVANNTNNVYYNNDIIMIQIDDSVKLSAYSIKYYKWLS